MFLRNFKTCRHRPVYEYSLASLVDATIKYFDVTLTRYPLVPNVLI